MRIVVIGGTRFIGPHVVRMLSARGHDVVVFHRGQTETDLPASVEHVHGDRQRLADFRDVFTRLAPEVVLDMVPIVEEHATAVVETFRGIARRIVAISSVDVYRTYGVFWRTEPGPPDSLPMTEDSPLRSTLYPHRQEPPRAPDDPRRDLDDYDKIPIERVVMSASEIAGTVLRLPMVYGPGDQGHRLHFIVKRMDDKRPVILLDEARASWRACWGYVENVAAAIALAVADDRAAGRIYNVAEPGAPSFRDWIERIGAEVGWRGRLIALPGESLPMHLRTDHNYAQHWVADTARIRNELGYVEAVPPDEALRRTIEWERSLPPENVDASQFDYAAEDAALASGPRRGT